VTRSGKSLNFDYLIPGVCGMSTVRFHCYKCGQQIIMGDKFWGEQVRCVSCKAVLTVPRTDESELPPVAEQAPIKSGDVTDLQTGEGTVGRSGAIAISLGIVAMIGMLTWALFLRDTWERDHRAELIELIIAADQQFTDGQVPAAIGQYEKALAQIGDHKVTDGEFAEAISRARKRTLDFRAEEAAAKRLEETAQQQELAKMEARRAGDASQSYVYPSRSYEDPRDRRWDNPNGREAIRAMAQEAGVSEAEMRKAVNDNLDSRGLSDWADGKR
jgi:hypothetical protein